MLMLTIVSVSYKSRWLLEENYKLIQACNPGVAFHWIVVQNTPKEFLEDDIAYDDPRFDVLPGPSLTVIEQTGPSFGSMHHAKGLNIALAYIKTPFVLCLDPDCFIVKKNWISQVINHMERKCLFFGITRGWVEMSRHWEFPVVSCFFIALDALQKQGSFLLDMQLDDKKAHALAHRITILHRHFLGSLSQSLQHYNRLCWSWKDKALLLYEWLAMRLPRLLRDHKETGSRMIKRYHGKGLSEVMITPGKEFRSPFRKKIEQMLPRKWRSIPDTQAYRSVCPVETWSDFLVDQYFWKGELFALHLHQTKYSLDHFEQEQYRKKWSDALQTSTETLLK